MLDNHLNKIKVMPKTKLKEFVEDKFEPSDLTTAMAMFVKNYGYLQASLPHSLLLSLKEECSVVQEKEKSSLNVHIEELKN